MLTETTDNYKYMNIKTVLKEFGLEGKKADIYLASLEMGSASVIEISKKAGVKRTTAYDIMLDLEKEGFIYETIKGKKRLFIVENPEKLKERLDKKRAMLSEILPELGSIYNIKGSKPKIRFYEGKEGLKEVYEDTLKFPIEILSFASDDIIKVLGQDWADDYIKRRVNKGINMRAIMPETETIDLKYTEFDQAHRRQSKLVNAKDYPFSIEINIYGHQKVAFMSALEETGIIIEGAEIHKTMKLIFELLWNNLPEIDRF